MQGDVLVRGVVQLRLRNLGGLAEASWLALHKCTNYA